MAKPNYELLKKAYSIIGGIPDDQFDLYHVVSQRGLSLDCGTIACAAGWLGMHPDFKALGLETKAHNLYVNGQLSLYSGAMERVFNINTQTAKQLFGMRRPGEGKWYDSDKQVWLKRVRDYLKRKGQL